MSFFSRLTGMGGKSWQLRDVVVVGAELRWMQPDGGSDKLTEAEVKERSADRSIPLTGVVVSSSPSEAPLPDDVASALGNTSMKFYTIEITMQGDPVPITLGFVDKKMMENLRDQIVQGIERAKA
jgi:hypothetical protein